MENSSSFVWLTLLAGVIVRWCVSLGPYSGKGKPPMYGDYEAQRHWMEITYNLNHTDWYRNTEENDLLYWGLDYPPLQAYHSRICGFMASLINKDWIALKSSRGFESYEHQIFMRATVLVTDLIFYFSGVLVYFMWTPSTRFKTGTDRVKSALLMLLYPGIILIDYGHFQYNCFSLGMTMWGIFLVSNGNYLLGAIDFVIALNFKQMELYHAFPFFCYILGIYVWKRGKENRVFKLFKIGTTVLATFVLCWYPFLSSRETILQVFGRLFPFSRGIYEDKVATVWCSLSVLVKFKNYLSSDKQVLLCLVSTIIGLIPSAIHLFRKPTSRNFKCALVNSSLVFFLFSYHVHEKSILLTALPVCLLLHENPFPCMWFLLISTFSMFPLLVKDGQITAYCGTMLLFYTVYKIIDDPSDCAGSDEFNSKKMLTVSSNVCYNLAFWCSMLGSLSLVLLHLFVMPPTRYPDLWPVLVSLYSCGHFVLFLVYFHVWQMYPTYIGTVGKSTKAEPVHSTRKQKLSKRLDIDNDGNTQTYTQITEEEMERIRDSHSGPIQRRSSRIKKKKIY